MKANSGSKDSRMSKHITPGYCDAYLYIHTHCETNEPLLIEVRDWNGRVDLLQYLKDSKNVEEIDIGVSLESWQEVKVEYDCDDGKIIAVGIRPAKIEGDDFGDVPSIRTEKLTTKRVQEATVVESDRSMLVSAANELVSNLSMKQVMPMLNSGVASQLDLLPDESKAYNAALQYLARQFETGHKDSETIITKRESERTEENRVQ